MTRSRILALDLLRQVAALVVLFQHFAMIFEVDTPQILRKGLFDAKAAVTLFFVLSGYVLALSFRKESCSFKSYVNFGVRRALRLYPLHFAATFLSLAVLFFIRNHGGIDLTPDLAVSFLTSADLSVKQWLLQLTLIMPGMRSDFANPPVWTLMTEAKISIIFPFLAWFFLRAPASVSLFACMAFVFASDWLAENTIGTFAVVGQFVIGILAARLPARVTERIPKSLWFLILGLSLLFYAAVSLRNDLPSIWIAYYIGAIGSAGLILSCVHWKPLNIQLSSFQEKIRYDLSYGIYILHFPIMILLKKLFHDSAVGGSLFLLLALSLLFTVILSWLLMLGIERPAIQLGKRLTGSTPKGAP